MRIMYSMLKRFQKKDLLYLRGLITTILANKLIHNEQLKLFWDDNGYTRNLHISLVNPSQDDLNIYKKHLTSETSRKILLLGSTPLLRYLLSNMGFKNYVVADFSFTTIENSLRALNELGINLEPNNEIWLKSNWLDMPLEPESLDCIVGDMVFTQIEPSRQMRFVNKLASLLKSDGSLIVRMSICNANFDDVDPQKIIEEILTSGTFENNTEQRFTLLYRLRDKLRDRKTQTTSPHSIINELLQYQTFDEKKLGFLRSVIKMISKRSEISLPFITQTKAELEQIIFKEFALETSEAASDYSSEYFPIYILRKKT